MPSASTIAAISLSLSVISTVIAIASYWHTRKIQSYEYATRLQLENERIVGGGEPEIFRYAADLVNVGTGPVEIKGIYIDYGGELPSTYYKFHVDGQFHLPSNGKRRIVYSITKDDYEAALSKFGLEECLFRLRVSFLNATGGAVDVTRNLIGLGQRKTTFYAQRGDSIV